MKYNFDDLKGRNCVITGGFGIIGLALCKGLAASGVNLAVISRKAGSSPRAKELEDEFGIKCIGISAAVTDKASLEKALEKIHAELGQVDILINCAGGNAPEATSKVEQITSADELPDSFYGLDLSGFGKVFDINFQGTVLATMVFTREMIEAGKGVVLNISSMNSVRPLTKIPAYSAAKGAINNFTQWFAVHVAPMGVRCNAIAPGFFLTDQNRFLLTDEATGELRPRGKKIVSNTPVHRFGEPEEIVGTMLYLLSDISAFVTGVIIPVDGGYSAFGGV